ncbi:MAG: hypothetical protein M3Y27_20645, partial [Acidobacteriota bacterium]|nr:hypothetical protein [Acidobacteriota bacterium]
KDNNWLPDDFGTLTGSFTNNDDSWPFNTWAAVGTPPDGRTIFGYSKYTWGDDIQYGPFIVPNGTYSVQFSFAISCTAGTTYSEMQVFDNGLTRGGTVGLEANGAMTLFSIGGAVLDQCLTPTTPSIQVVVTNKLLSVALRSTSVGNTQQSPFLNALVITRVDAIPTGGSITAGSLDPPHAVTATNSGMEVPGTGLLFVPVTPCRVIDTRGADGPEITAASTRSFAISGGPCGIPGTAQAYSLNVTVVPKGQLGYLSIWASGQPQPMVSTLNSVDGRVKANAAIVPAGTNGAVSVFANGDTQIILDISGYFISGADNTGLAFYPLVPCRIGDTRNVGDLFGGPLSTGEIRNLPVQLSPCNVPRTAQAYSLNFTVVPRGGLGYLSTWPTGQSQPLVSTLNDEEGKVVANAAIVPAGSLGDISVFVNQTTDVVVDINGYFAVPGNGGMSLYNVTPCRVLDTRAANGVFNGILSVDVSAAHCSVPSTAQGYILNATVVPVRELGYLSLWAHGQTQPWVSTLNAVDGSITSNMAIVPTADGSVSAFGENSTQLILDLFGYFAPSP